MRPSKFFHPDKGRSGAKGYYETRGKIHLMHYSAQEPPETEAKAWCGVKLENCNGVTSKTEECTCQKCLMVMTGTWRKGK